MDYTKGEWLACCNSNTKPHTIRIAVEYKGRLLPLDDKHKHLIATLDNRDKSIAECDANAHLIAAAPDMYEALKEMLPLAKQWIKFLQTNVGQAQGKDVNFQRAELALAKAEGKS